MRVLMQRVREAAVSVLNELNGIDPTFEQRYMGPGLVLTVEAEPGDDEREAVRFDPGYKRRDHVDSPTPDRC